MSESGRAFSLSANHVGIGVSDLSRSIAFYRDVLGFNVAYERGEVTAEYMPRLVGIPGARLKIAGLDIPGLHLDLIEYIEPKGAPQAGPPNDVGNVHIGFTVDDMWAAYHALVAAGVRFMSEPVSPTVGPNKGGWAVYFVDPDGVTLEMIQKPRAEGTGDRG
ncbi:MAG TPA: VOC family protein [Chloroflexota bacterium]|nr:VOC family protein [Chloroflexota bacterium]